MCHLILQAWGAYAWPQLLGFLLVDLVADWCRSTHFSDRGGRQSLVISQAISFSAPSQFGLAAPTIFQSDPNAVNAARTSFGSLVHGILASQGRSSLSLSSKAGQRLWVARNIVG